MRRALLMALLLTTAALAGCTGRSDDDRDRDGLKNAEEGDQRVITVVLANGTFARTVTSDPDDADSDGDGLKDGEEYARDTDPRDPDTDRDGLLDGADVTPSEARAAEWRAKGIVDVNGTFLGEADACADRSRSLKPNVWSSDLPAADGLADGDELRGWDITLGGSTRRVTSDPCTSDTDTDGLLDHDERAAGTDPRDPDSENDGARDGYDADPRADLALAFGDLVASPPSNVTSVRLLFTVAAATAGLGWPGNGTTTLDVPDTTVDRASLEASVIITAEDRATGQPLALFPDPRGVVVTFDLLKGTVTGATAEGDTLSFQGADGSVSFSWSAVRR